MTLPQPPPSLPHYYRPANRPLPWRGLSFIIGAAFILVCVLGGVGFAAAKRAMLRAKMTSANTDAKELEAAVGRFVAAYGKLPQVSATPALLDRTIDMNGTDGATLLTIFEAKETGPVKQNPRGLRLHFSTTTTHVMPGLPTELLDPWGRPFKVVFDYNLDGSITPPPDSGVSSPVTGHQALAYSLGPDRKGGSGAIRSW